MPNKLAKAWVTQRYTCFAMDNKAQFVWNGADRVGNYCLGQAIEGIENITRLSRLEDEDFDVFEIANAAGSKLFVKNGRIAAIQCGLSFVYQGRELIGAPIADSLAQLNAWRFSDKGQGQWIAEGGRLKLFALDSGVTRWLILNAPEF